MKNFKFLLLWLFTPLFIGVSFGNSIDLNTFDFVWNYWKAYVNWSNMENTFDPNVVFASDKLYCLNVKSFTCEYPAYWGWWSCNYNVDLMLDNPNSVISYLFTNSLRISRDNSLSVQNNVWSVWCFMSDSSSFVPIDRLPDYVSFNFDLYSKDVFTIWSSDCSSFETQLNQCQSDLNTCQNDWSHCDTLYWKCVEDYSWCQSNLSSLENYNQSLTEQLNECLNNSTASWDDANSWNCLTNSLFWFNNDNMLSLPITNNLFLPNGYQWYVNSWWVLWISDIENNTVVYEFDQESKENTINSMSIIMLFLVATWFIMFVIKFLKKLFFKS